LKNSSPKSATQENPCVIITYGEQITQPRMKQKFFGSKILEMNYFVSVDSSVDPSPSGISTPIKPLSLNTPQPLSLKWLKDMTRI